jgi:histidinol-phosphate/aromatic aminotransferase/cobyric acid decarboxylase-like protein
VPILGDYALNSTTKNDASTDVVRPTNHDLWTELDSILMTPRKNPFFVYIQNPHNP